MSTPFEISDEFTERWADLSPVSATTNGITGRDHLCTDYSPEGHAERADLYRVTKSSLAPHLDHPGEDQAFAAKVLTGWLGTKISDYEKGKWTRDLNHIYSPFQITRDAFDVMATNTARDWDNIRSRLRGIRGMLEGYRASLTLGIEDGDTVARRQAESLLEQVEAAASENSRFSKLPAKADDVGANSDAVTAAVDAARAACSDFGTWLRSTYLPASREDDGVGEERYMEGAESFLGMSFDPHEAYEWGWSEVHRLRSEMSSTAKEIDPGKTIEEVVELLDNDPERSAATRAEFVAFVSDLQKTAIARLAGEHFDVPDELRTVSVNIAPPGGNLGAWYVGPSEDFTRPGSIWYAPGARERLPYWQEVSTAFHEGFPGHHLQVGTAVMQRERLSRFHRLVIWYPGSGEGWALYAERLMDELGFLENPEYRLGLVSSQLFRATRVVVDIGCQLQKRIPDDAPLHAGELWDYERAVDYMHRIGLQALDVAQSEVKRYLGWWGQAISYKLGERVMLEIRDEEMNRQGAAFDRKDFHRRVLEAGAIRLDHLREEMT